VVDGGQESGRAGAARGRDAAAGPEDLGHWERAGGGLTPLHIGYGRAGAVPVLLELGADPEAPDGQGRTPLEVLARTPRYPSPQAFAGARARERSTATTTTTLCPWRRRGRGCGARRRTRRDARCDLPTGDDGEPATRVRNYA
jgi:hypothetical protein